MDEKEEGHEGIEYHEDSDEDSENDHVPWKEKSTKQKTCYLIEFPLVWIRKFTIPPADEHHYDNFFTLAWPWLGLPVNYVLYS